MPKLSRRFRPAKVAEPELTRFDPQMVAHMKRYHEGHLLPRLRRYAFGAVARDVILGAIVLALIVTLYVKGVL